MKKKILLFFLITIFIIVGLTFRPLKSSSSSGNRLSSGSSKIERNQWESRPIFIDPKNEPCFKLSSCMPGGMGSSGTDIFIVGGKVVQVYAYNTFDGGFDNNYFFIDNQLVGFESKNHESRILTGKGKEPFTEELNQTTYLISNKRITKCYNGFGQEKMSFSQLIQAEKDLQKSATGFLNIFLDSQKWPAEKIEEQNSERANYGSWRLEHLQPNSGSIMHPIVKAVKFGNASESLQAISQLSVENDFNDCRGNKISKDSLVQQAMLAAIEVENLNSLKSLINIPREIVNKEKFYHDYYVLKSKYSLTEEEKLDLQLLESQDSVVIKSFLENKLLAHAVKFGKLRILKVLIENKILPENRERYGFLLALAAKNGNLEVVEFIIDLLDLENSNFKNSQEIINVLKNAVLLKNDKIVSFLIEKGLLKEIDTSDLAGILNAGVQAENRNAIDKLVELFPPNTLNYMSAYESALITGVKDKKSHIVAFLLQIGISPNLEDASGNSILFAALENAWTQGGCQPDKQDPLSIVDMLLDADIKIPKQDRKGKDLIEYLIDVGNLKLFSRLIPHLDLKEDKVVSKTIQLALDNRQFGQVDFLIDSLENFDIQKHCENAFVSSLEKNNSDALYYLFRRGFALLKSEMKAPVTFLISKRVAYDSYWPYTEKTLDILIDAGASVNDVDEKGMNAMDYALLCKPEFSSKCLEYLKKHGASPSYIGMALRGDLEGLKEAVREGKNLNIADENKNSLLHLVAKSNHVEMIKFLVKNGMKVDSINESGKSPLWIALANNKLEAAKALISLGANINLKGSRLNDTILEDLVARHDRNIDGKLSFLTNIETIKFMLDNGADIKPANYRGEKTSVLWRLICNPGFENRSEVAELLIKYGADVNEPTMEEQTLLHRAAYMGWKADANWLIEHGANKNALNKNGKTPLQYALERPDYEMADFLKSLGCK